MTIPTEILTALATGVLTIPGTVLAHRALMRKQAQDAETAFDDRMLAALKNRDDTIAAQNDRIDRMQAVHGDLYKSLGAHEARIAQLNAVQEQRDQRERDQLRKVATLEERVKQLDDCVGGQPCPLAMSRRLA